MSTTRSRTATAALAAIAVAVLASPAGPAAQGEVIAHAPTVTTGLVVLHSGTLSFSGTVNPQGSETKFYFRYGPSVKALEVHTKTETLSKEAFEAVKVYVALPKGFAKGAYQLVAENKQGPKEGKPREYTGASKGPGDKTETKKSAFRLPSTFQPTLVGGSFTFSGTLTGAGDSGRLVALQATPYPYTAPFTQYGPLATTSASGAFSFHVAALARNTRFRVATVAAPLLYSYSVTELAEVRVSLKVQSSKHFKGLVRLYGTVSPAAAGAEVFFQIEKQAKAKEPKAEKPEKPNESEAEEKPIFGTKFATSVKHATQRFSRFSLIVKVLESGSYRAYVRMPSGPYASGQSETVTLTAVKKTKKKSKP